MCEKPPDLPRNTTYRGSGGELAVSKSIDGPLPFDEQGKRIECESTAGSAVSETITARLGEDPSGVIVTIGSEGVTVFYEWITDRDGCLTASPSVRFEELRQVTPPNMAVTLDSTMDDETYSCSHRVRLEKRIRRLG